MELISGFLLWLLDVAGIRTIRKEEIIYKKVLKSLAFFMVAFICLVGWFIISS